MSLLLLLLFNRFMVPIVTPDSLSPFCRPLGTQQDILRRELVRAKEVNLKLAAKMTKLEEAVAKAGAKVS